MSDDAATLTGEELYDTIMSQIEPELMSSSLPKLTELYQHETPQQKTKRNLRYQKAFMQFDVMFDHIVLDPLDRLQIYEEKVLEQINAADTKRKD